jgi:hypothetical protein
MLPGRQQDSVTGPMAALSPVCVHGPMSDVTVLTAALSMAQDLDSPESIPEVWDHRLVTVQGQNPIPSWKGT